MPDATPDARPQIDLLDFDRFTEGIPHEWFTWLRRNEPVHHHPEPDGPGFWVITKLDDVTVCNRDAGTFSSAAARGGVVGLTERPPTEGDAPSEAGNLMLFMDPPDHTRYRRLVNRGFTPRMIGQMEVHIRDLTTTILDRVLASSGPQGESDFVVDIAAELPLEVIAELIGVPTEDRHKIFDWSNRMIGADDPEYAVSQEKLFEAQVEMFMYAQGLAEKHRQKPEDDIINALLSAEVDGESLSDMDFNLFFLLLSVAGNETTRNAISHGMNAFLENPDQWELLASDPDRHIKGAVEEILRWASPVLYFRRNATQDFELRGHTIRAGDKISMWYISANRDEDHFEDPFRFDITRDPNHHIAFGGGGPHFCLGAQLARMEIQVLFEELVKRVDHVESLGPPDRLRSNFIGGIKHLPVRFHPR
ncbi:cytochrome P450 [Iamia sp. SCSIO 61187]|uniref:cytochrome P450 n=1 Tax=Iamia sp. SCSIO 61187 TaxID=2722752 RepID=UPI001C63B632|nr:cytochrome P450 [Iamia sp. SCSIO 61187]QYG93633.1 cytochrome P450 [Iamia sp. SCSIO 61187]